MTKRCVVLLILFGLLHPHGGLAAPAGISVTITSPLAGSVQTSATVMVTGTSSPGSQLTLSIDGSSAETVTADGAGTWTHTLTNLRDGDHQVQISARRAATPLLWMAVIQPSAIRDQAIVADPATGMIVARIDLSGDGVEGISLTRDGRVAYVCHDAGVDVIDALTYTVSTTIPLPSGPELCQLNPAETELWITQPDREGLAVLNTTTHALDFIPLLNHAAPHEVIFSPDGAVAYTANVETLNDPATVTKLDTATKQVLLQVPGGRANRRLTLTPDGSRLFVAAKNSGQVLVFNPATMARLATISINVANDTEDLVVDAGRQRVYVSQQQTSALAVLDATTLALLPGEALPAAGLEPTINAVTLHPGFPDRVFVGNRDDVDVLDVTTGAPIAAMHMQHTPIGTGTRTYEFAWQEREDTASAQVAFTVDTSLDLALTKTVQGPVVAGQPLTYTLQVENYGPALASGPITVTDALPTQLLPRLATGEGWACTTTAQTVTCIRAAALDANTQAPPILLQVLVDEAAVGQIDNTATVYSPQDPDTNPANNTSSTTITLLPPTATSLPTASVIVPSPTAGLPTATPPLASVTPAPVTATPLLPTDGPLLTPVPTALVPSVLPATPTVRVTPVVPPTREPSTPIPAAPAPPASGVRAALPVTGAAESNDTAWRWWGVMGAILIAGVVVVVRRRIGGRV